MLFRSRTTKEPDGAGATAAPAEKSSEPAPATAAEAGGADAAVDDGHPLLVGKTLQDLMDLMNSLLKQPNGGVKIKAGSDIYDGSVAGRLAALNDTL